MTIIPAVPLIKQWLARRGVTPYSFARRANLDTSEFAKLLSGKRKSVSIEIAAKIEDATGGEIGIRTFIPKEVPGEGE